MTNLSDAGRRRTVRTMKAVKISQSRRRCGCIMAEIHLLALAALGCRREMIDKCLREV